jgi:alanine or glycine:cation symporter, AGCS family
MELFAQIVNTLNSIVWGFGIPAGEETIPLVVVALLGTGFFLTVRLGFIQLRRFGHGVAVTTGRYDNPAVKGDVPHFQALTTALSATVGIGNIAGVAIAIHWGGPGALFWMWMTALFGMAVKFTEVTLSQTFRNVDETGDAKKGTVAGGPMYYIERGLGPKWKPMAVFFAIMLGLTAFLTGNGVQANTVADTMESAFGLPPWLTGLVTAVLVGAVILGGIKRIGRVTSVLAPLMAGIYVFGALIIIFMNLGAVLPTFGLIFSEAFNPSAGVAGTGVGAFLVTMMWGVKRGLFSNEAGQGSSPIAHAASKTDEPVSEGLVALLGPFIDTICICSMTALVIIITGVWDDQVPTTVPLSSRTITYVVHEDGRRSVGPAPTEIHVEDGLPVEAPGEGRIAWHDVPVPRFYLDAGQTQPFTGVIRPGSATAHDRDGNTYTTLYGPAVTNGAPLTMLGFQRGLAPLGNWGHYIVLLSVLFFGISTAISWSYYGDRCAHYLLGERAIMPYRVVYLFMHYAGAVLPLAAVWALGDVMLGIVILPNLTALLLLSPVVAAAVASYFRRKPWIENERLRREYLERKKAEEQAVR